MSPAHHAASVNALRSSGKSSFRDRAWRKPSRAATQSCRLYAARAPSRDMSPPTVLVAAAVQHYPPSSSCGTRTLMRGKVGPPRSQGPRASGPPARVANVLRDMLDAGGEAMHTQRTIGIILLGCVLAGFAVLAGLVLWLGPTWGAVAGGAAAAIVAVVYVTVIGPWQRHWGARPEVSRASMPGDDLLRADAPATTRAIEIDAPPERVFPWL